MKHPRKEKAERQDRSINTAIVLKLFLRGDSVYFGGEACECFSLNNRYCRNMCKVYTLYCILV